MLSDRQIRNLKSGKTDRWLNDRDGLYLRLRATGARSWVLRRKRAGKTEVITLGVWPALGLSEARKKAAALTGRRVSNITLGALLEMWHADMVARKYRRPQVVSAYFDRLEPALKATKLRNLESVEIRDSLRRYAHERGPVGANRFLSILKTALLFARNAGYIDASPIDRMSSDIVGGEETARERTLTDVEIQKLLKAESQHAALLRFLLLTGQRIGEAQRATWAHVHKDRWFIPVAHAKNKRAHWVALSTQALSLLNSQDKQRTLIFGRVTNTGVQAWLRRWCERENVDPAFTPHDLRRTTATRMGDLGVMPHIVERLLNHKLQGVMAVYNRAEYETERTEAMQLWADMLETIESVAPAK